jgi:ubiquinone/menaquinone biosynthesis C-methylase UbiE
MARDANVWMTETPAAVPDTPRRAKMRAKVNERAADVALAAVPVPLRVLDIGCREGALVRELVARLPNVLEITGIDGDEEMVREARRQTEGFPRFRQGFPEHLPFPEAHFDLVVTALSFAGWVDQVRGLHEVARVLQPGGAIVLADLSPGWRPRRDDPPRIAPPRAISRLLTEADLRLERREVLYRRLGLPYARAFIASR